MSAQAALLPWDQPGWLALVSAWITEALARQGIEVRGAIEQPHMRPWSTALRVPTSAGDCYVKAVAPLLAHEIPLTQALARWRPDDTLPVLAADQERGWLLLPDGGARLRETIRADRDLRHWEALLPRYAELQQALAGRVPELLALGAPDRRLLALPAQYAQLLADSAALRVDLPDGLTSAEVRRLSALAPRLSDLCAELAGCGVAESLHHGDLHDGNIFAGDGGYRLFDWGDSCVSHPFLSLRTAFVSVEISLGLEEGATELDRLRDAYLEPWAHAAPLAQLREAFAHAQAIAAICGALGWQRALAPLAEPLRAAYTRPVPSLLREFLGSAAIGA